MKIFKVRAFHFTILLLLLYSILLLNQERYEVNYRLDERINIKFQYLECVYLTNLFNNQSIINLNQINSDYFYNILKERGSFNRLNSDKATKFILDQIKLKNYLIFNRKFCLINQNKISNFHHYFNEENLNYFIFIDRTFKIWKFENNNYYNNIDNFEKLTVLKLEYPYSDCRLINNKFRCLNECYKRNYKISKYCYNSYENGLIYLNYQLNKTILDNEKLCLKQCKNQIGCEIHYFKQKGSKLIQSTIIAFESIDTFNYYIQLIGLISLLINIPINQFLIKLLIITDLKIKLFKNFKIIILIFNLILISILYFINIIDFIDKRDNPIKKELIINSYQFNEFNLAICLPFNQLIEEEDDLFFLNRRKYLNRTFSELEKLTELNKDSIEIYIEYQKYRLNLNWKLDPLVIFLFNKRCYQIKISLINFKNKSTLSLFKLIIKLNYLYFDLYILSENERLNKHTYKYSRLFNFMKKIVIRSKTNKNDKCINYNDLNLNSKTQCIHQCKFNRSYSKSNEIFFKSFTYKDYFNEQEWTSLTLNNYMFNEKEDDDCDKKCPYEDCDIAYFIEQNKNKDVNHHILNEDRGIKFNLFYDVKILIDEERSFLKLLLDLLNIQIIIFGLNAFKLITIVLKFFNLNFKFSINLLCLIGFSYHLWFIFNQIINNDLIYIQYYNEEGKCKMPDLIFGFENLIQLNQTSDVLKIDNLFDRIKYLNKLNEWKLIDKKSNYSDDQFRIFSRNHSNKIYFEIKSNIEYDSDQFEFEDKKINLKIYFNKSTINQFNIVNFATRLNNDISQLSYMNLKASFFIMTSELFELIYNDKFRFFKNPLSLFNDNEYLNNADQYLNSIVDNLEKNLRKNSIDTQKIDNPVEKYFNPIQNKSINRKTLFINNNLHQETKSFYKNFNDADFKYNLNFFKRTILITNEDNFIKLILNLINVISFWYDIGLFDLHIYFKKVIIWFKYFFVHLYELLFKIRPKLLF